MRFEQHLRSPKGNLFTFYFWYGLFWFNNKMIKNSCFEKTLWDHLKCELFYVAGQCQHSGNCCRQVMIIRKGEKMESPDAFHDLAHRDPIYRRFNPVVRNKKILHYTCSCLTKENLCNDYANRPSFCRTYPFSAFLQEDKIENACGYFIQKKSISPWFRNKTLTRLINNLYEQNKKLRR